MEEYLQCVKTLRFQMNDMEDQAAKISLEEQMQLTTVQTMEKDLTSAQSGTRQLKEDVERILLAKSQICSQILENRSIISSLESDSSTLSQILEIMKQEQVSMSAKLIEKSTYYTQVAKDINGQLQQQQDCVNANKAGRELGIRELVKDKIDEKSDDISGFISSVEGDSGIYCHPSFDNMEVEARKNIISKLNSAKAKLDEISQMKSVLAIENLKITLSVEEMKGRTTKFKPEASEMDKKSLEEEYKAILTDKAGETEYLQSLEDQIEKLKGISHMIKCTCGEEYNVRVGQCA